MQFPQKRYLSVQIVIALTILIAAALGVGLGYILSGTANIKYTEEFGEYEQALPTQVLDRNGRLITEFFSEEKREIVAIDELPEHLIFALITREDKGFFKHNGFSLKHTVRAVFQIVTGQLFSGGSTITQQLAGHLYADRSEISITRKLKELWWAFQLERRLTKLEILELYLNKMPFGHNTYGVQAASEFYFNHPATEMTLAESAMLVIQLVRPGLYSPIRHPNRAQRVQYEILNQMVELGYTDRETAERSYQEYWNSYDYTRSNTTTAFFERKDKAPYFSEYIRGRLEELMYGSLDIYRDGFTVHTTLDLDYQQQAQQLMSSGIARVNSVFQSQTSKRQNYAEDKFLPIINLLGLSFNVEDMHISTSIQSKRAKDFYHEQINPAVDMISLMFGLDDLKFASSMAYSQQEKEAERTTVQGALITLENGSGHILAMIGGSQFDRTNQFNRAVQAKVQPGSSFKPLYYSRAIESKTFTPASFIYDAPVVFWNDDGTPYTPLNYRGRWRGPVRLRFALAHSMNVPSLKVLDAIGFDAAIDNASSLLGIHDPQEIARNFPRKYPLGLGIIEVAPIQMARAYATFPNKGKEVIPIGISHIEDNSGNIILEPEKELRSRQAKKGEEAQLLTPQTAYIMVDMLSTTVESGTLSYARRTADGFPMPMGGKTGTTQNWSDAWAMGFSPYVTTAVWFGFDRPGYSLGTNQSGAVAAGPVWAQYMKRIHQNLEPKEFEKPETGLQEVTVCAVSGDLPTEYCDEGTIEEIFLDGTEPDSFCSYHEFENRRNSVMVKKLEDSMLTEDLSLQDDFNTFSEFEELDESLDSLELELDVAPDMQPGTAPDDTESEADEDQRETDTSNPLLD
ncbi:MAG: PBP1A family penicillin-binding protein [Spirochaetales bacterium]|nr:PBP1A family penicillin-binding protein [Spirochaetales bacterium]MCF7937299.1 PBP1A family penicillin-binding protein [Spirochaetales bacterium]